MKMPNPRQIPFLSSAHPSNREITANNVRGLLSYRDTLVWPPLPLPVPLPLCRLVAVTGFSTSSCPFVADIWRIRVHSLDRRRDEKKREREREILARVCSQSTDLSHSTRSPTRGNWKAGWQSGWLIPLEPPATPVAVFSSLSFLSLFLFHPLPRR